MPKSPSVNFVVKNDNVATYTPLMGVSTVLARTKKGPFNDPSTLVTNLTQFRDIYGEEIVPDGSASNIEKALSLGSKLRIIRVPGTGYYDGLVFTLHDTSIDTSPTHIDVDTEVGTVLRISGKYPGSGVPKSFEYKIGFRVNLYNDSVTSPIYTVRWYKKVNTLYCQILDDTYGVLYSGPVITVQQSTQNPNTPNSIDYLAFSNFLLNNPYLKPVIKSGGSIDTLLTDLMKADGTSEVLGFTLYDTEGEDYTPFSNTTFNPVINFLYQGYAGTIPGVSEWVNSLQYLRDDTESYQVILSHLSQVYLGTETNEGHLSWSDALTVYGAAAEIAKELEEFVLYVEVPKFKKDDPLKPVDKADLIAISEALIGTLGNSRYIAYFGGGIKYYNSFGILTSSDVLGTVTGLGDASASDYGPWRSFAGLNRGVIYDGNGPVSPNYGSPSRYNELNEIAEHYINLIVTKNTYNSGIQTVLWHCFTTQVKQDSFKFLSVVRLVLYLKKSLRPILDRYIEEPNIWNTWSDIYYEVKPLLDSLITQRAMSEYEWMGDQFATSYKDLQINNEADVRQGKYKVVLKFKEVVPMQDITVVLYIDKASNNISVETE